jgi:hypothetical protein
MPRTALTKTLVPTEVGITAGTLMTYTAADVGNSNSVPLTGAEIVIAQNTDAAIHNVTISSVGDAKGRKGDITTDPVAANSSKVYCRHSVDGWRQTDGNLYLSADNALIKFCVLQLPF